MPMFDGAKPIKLSGAVAGAGLTADSVQFKFVKLSADNTVVLCAATTDIAIGVLQAPVKATGDPVDVTVAGETMVQAGASITAGQPIGPNASGQAQTAVATQFVAGVAVNVAGGISAGNLITAVVNCANPTVV